MTRSGLMTLTLALLLPFPMVASGAIGPGAAAQERDTTVYAPGDGVTLPRLIKEVKAEYTPEAKAAKIQGTVIVEAVVRSDGTVGDVTILHSLDEKFGLDHEAVKATRQWVFEPGRKDGKLVAVRVTIEHTFTLK